MNKTILPPPPQRLKILLIFKSSFPHDSSQSLPPISRHPTGFWSLHDRRRKFIIHPLSSSHPSYHPLLPQFKVTGGRPQHPPLLCVICMNSLFFHLPSHYYFQQFPLITSLFPKYNLEVLLSAKQLCFPPLKQQLRHTLRLLPLKGSTLTISFLTAIC